MSYADTLLNVVQKDEFISRLELFHRTIEKSLPFIINDGFTGTREQYHNGAIDILLNYELITERNGMLCLGKNFRLRARYVTPDEIIVEKLLVLYEASNKTAVSRSDLMAATSTQLKRYRQKNGVKMQALYYFVWVLERLEDSEYITHEKIKGPRGRRLVSFYKPTDKVLP